MDDILPPLKFETFGPGGFLALPYNQTIEDFIDIIIEEQDKDKLEEREYLGYVKYILNDKSKYYLFSKLFPNNTCNEEIIMNDDGLVISYEYVECINNRENSDSITAIFFIYRNHANAMIFDHIEKKIERYDPQVPGYEEDQKILDRKLADYFHFLFPQYEYIGNNLIDTQCVQTVREQGRTYKADYFCQDYSLLYILERFTGSTHVEAAEDLVSRGDKIINDLRNLLRLLAYAD